MFSVGQADSDGQESSESSVNDVGSVGENWEVHFRLRNQLGIGETKKSFSEIGSLNSRRRIVIDRQV